MRSDITSETAGPLEWTTGEEFTFGIYMRKLLEQPILIIKTAWGGKSLHTDFRPPSAGPYELNQQELEQYTKRGMDLDEWKADIAMATGHHYRLMTDHVKKVLKDINKVCPGYDRQQGYQLAGFDDSEWSRGKAPIGKAFAEAADGINASAK